MKEKKQKERIKEKNNKGKDLSSLTSISSSGLIKKIELYTFPYQAPSPFLYTTFHKDKYPANRNDLENPVLSKTKSTYKLYHTTSSVPGFPFHPHRGMETLSCSLKGFVDHHDSLGWRGRYGEGDLQWMTAGKGVAHSEMFPLIYEDKPNTLELFQIWLNLPKRLKGTKPKIGMTWSEEVPRYKSNSIEVTLWVGSLTITNLSEIGVEKKIDLSILPPVSQTWAAIPENEVTVSYISLKPEGKIRIHETTSSDPHEINRLLFFLEGNCSLKILNKTFIKGQVVHLNSSIAFDLFNSGEIAEEEGTVGREGNGNSVCTFLLLQGREIKENVVQDGPFVMNSQEEITNAREEYNRTKYGDFLKWWSIDGPIINSRSYERFLEHPTNGKKILAPSFRENIEDNLESMINNNLTVNDE